MKLKLADIDEFIRTRSVKQITSTKIYQGGGRNTFDPNGLFSEAIFGRVGSRQRKTTFGYIDLKCKIIHPEALPILSSLNINITKMILNKVKYRVEGGILIPDEKNGDSGVSFFIKVFDELDLTKLVEKSKEKYLKFISNNRHLLFITKYLVIPAGVRDIQQSQKGNQMRMQHSELSTLYERLLRQTHNIFGDVDFLPSDIIAPVISTIQKTLKDINSWIKELLKGKQGLIRGGLLRKVTDYSARLVITPDPLLKLGFVGIPWQIALKLYEPFSIHEIMNNRKKDQELIKKFIGLDSAELDINDIKRFISNVVNDPSAIEGELKKLLLEVAEAATKNKVLIYKRDPSENRNTWQSSYIRIDDTGYVMKISPYDLNHKNAWVLYQ